MFLFTSRKGAKAQRFFIKDIRRAFAPLREIVLIQQIRGGLSA